MGLVWEHLKSELSGDEPKTVGEMLESVESAGSRRRHMKLPGSKEVRSILGSFEVGGFSVWRAKVPGGWLIAMRSSHGSSLTFYPDPDHAWDGQSVP
jgi:hypothetical protein